MFVPLVYTYHTLSYHTIYLKHPNPKNSSGRSLGGAAQLRVGGWSRAPSGPGEDALGPFKNGGFVGAGPERKPENMENSWDLIGIW